MVTLIRRIVEGYHYVNDELSDPRTKDYLLIGTPWACFCIIGFYLYFIFDLGPKYMEKKKPFDLTKILRIYNVLQIVLCGYIFYKALVLGWLNDYSFVCQPIDFSTAPKSVEVTRIVWVYFLIKVFDLLDTVFFVLRKKQNQVSFLHVYHHAGMVLGSWVATKFLPGGHVTFLGLINSFVHMVMYSHYLATSFRISRPWWKKYITQLQLTQFLILLLQYIQLVLKKDCQFPRWTAAAFIPQNLFMIVLFFDFYYKAYIKKPKTKSTQNGFPSEATNGKLKSQ